MADLLDQAAAEIIRLKQYEDRVEDELVCCGILAFPRHKDPKVALNDAINWNVEVASFFDEEKIVMGYNLVKEMYDWTNYKDTPWAVKAKEFIDLTKPVVEKKART